MLASKKGGAGGKVDFWVYTAELAGELAEASKQKLKLVNIRSTHPLKNHRVSTSLKCVFKG